MKDMVSLYYHFTTFFSSGGVCEKKKSRRSRSRSVFSWPWTHFLSFLPGGGGGHSTNFIAARCSSRLVRFKHHNVLMKVIFNRSFFGGAEILNGLTFDRS
jgi:hypothetical protein